MHVTLLCLLLLFAGSSVAAESARVMIVGTYHFSNPGADLHNVQSDDVLLPERQKQLEAIDGAIVKFRPTRVAVEWPKDVVDERYAKFRAGELAPSRNEVVQLGFRVARTAGLDAVHGIDVDGEFPYEPVATWAAANGMADGLAAANLAVQKSVEKITALQREHVAAALKYLNAPAQIDADWSFYAELMRYGGGDEQPGAKLLAAWTVRNLEICARLVQVARPGDRVVVFYGSGHAYLLRRCVRETPGLALVEANGYLP